MPMGIRELQMDENKNEAAAAPTETPAAEAPAAEAEATPNRTDTKFLKVSREQFDKVLRFGADGFLNTQLERLTTDQITRMDAWVRELRAQKTKETYLTFPVSTPKQQAAGNLYLKALSRIQVRVREVMALREAQDIFSAPAEAKETAAA